MCLISRSRPRAPDKIRPDCFCIFKRLRFQRYSPNVINPKDTSTEKRISCRNYRTAELRDIILTFCILRFVPQKTTASGITCKPLLFCNYKTQRETI
ncbi:MAG: hypothetical protein DRH32_03595 [Deltaproteobacteria bacterium]|nr:MAG: hypothetical protein DRH32_03595 [Deltaproteobacteria bacterium]